MNRTPSGGDQSPVVVGVRPRSRSRSLSPSVDDFAVVDERVDHGGGDDLVAEHLAPAAKWLLLQPVAQPARETQRSHVRRTHRRRPGDRDGYVNGSPPANRAPHRPGNLRACARAHRA